MDKKKIAGGFALFLCLLWGLGKLKSSSSSARSDEAGAAAQSTDKWKVSTSRSPMDDSQTVVLSVDSDDMVQGPLGEVRPTLIVRCKEKKTAVYVVTGMAAKIEEGIDGGPSDSHKVRLRLDDGPASYDSWGESTDHKVLFAGDVVYDSNGHFSEISGGAALFAKKLASAKTLSFEFTPFNGNPQAVRFDIRGLDTHLAEVAEPCGRSAE